MARGFFVPPSRLKVLRPREALVPKCGACGLFKRCHSPKMPTSGGGARKVLIVAEAPGKDEDEQGVQLVGNSGQELVKVLRRFGVDMREDCWLDNALICRPPANKIEDARWIDYCRPNVISTIERLQPTTIILLGGIAVKSVVPWLWGDDESPGGITRWAGFQIPSQKVNAWVCPTFHPAYFLHAKDRGSVEERRYERHLEAAFALSGRPWEAPPDYASRVRCVFDLEEAAREIDGFTDRNLPTAFDYECNMLKPDSDLAEIVCVSLSDGENTVAVPWGGPVVRAMRRFLTSPVPKIGWHLKFEDRWSMAVAGVEVNYGEWPDFPGGWSGWDGMLTAHAEDNRPGVTGCKFQAFARLGMPKWNSHLEVLLKSDAPNLPNRIREIDLRDLLLYNGLDSLLEHTIAFVQMREFGLVG